MKDKKKRGKAPARQAEDKIATLEDVTTCFKKHARLAPSEKVKLLQKVIEEYEEKSLPPHNICCGEYIGPKVGVALGKALIEVKYNILKSLCFWKAGIGDEGAIQLAQCVSELPALEKLDFQACHIGPIGCKAIGEAVSKNCVLYRSLQYLTLDFNEFGDDGAKQLSSGFSQNDNSIKKLSMAHCNLGRHSANHLYSMIKVCIAMEELCLAHNELEEEGVRIIIKGVSHLHMKSHALNFIDMSSVSLGQGESSQKAIVDLCQIYRNYEHLSGLDLQGNQISNKQAELLASMVRGSIHIKVFKLSINISPLIMKELFECLASRVKKKKKKGKGKKKKKKKG